ncbi:MAG: hypothetical protein R8P61_04975 [Bacteroidia bacterium]|nr:hypothetical protein [Bacteroidia bacterium]
MKTWLASLLICLILIPSHAQERQYFRLKKKSKKRHVVITPDLNGSIIMLRISGYFDKAKQISYLDTLSGYQISVPDYLEMWDSDKYNMLNALFPEIEGIRNAVSITSYRKDAFDGFQGFKNYIIEDSTYGLGVKPPWSGGQSFLEIERKNYKTMEGFVVDQVFRGGVYRAFYYLIETPKAYLWANFVATPETYELNIDRFYQFISRLKFIEGQN